MRPPLVLLHAFGAAGRTYGLLSAAQGGKAHVLAPDLPGFGGAPDLPAPSVAAYADWVAAFVAAQAPEGAVLGGWSMGGKIALALAARRPPWLRGLVLIAPSPPSPEPMQEADRVRQLAGHGDAALARRSVESLIVGPASEAAVEATVADRLATSPAAWRWWLEAGSREDLDLGPPLETPTLLVVGAQDPNLGEAAQRRDTLPRLARAEAAVLDDCGHFAPLEQPEALARTVEAWTERLPDFDRPPAGW